MQAGTVARNYADTLLTLAQRQNAVEEFGRALEEVVEILNTEPQVRRFLESPTINRDAKKRALQGSFAGRVPELFLRFLLVVTEKGREALLPEIAAAYRDLVDEMLDRVRARVTLAEPADAELQREIRVFLERRLGKTVLPEFSVDPEMLGGVVIRVEDQIIDGSLRRRFSELRRRLLETRIPREAAIQA